MAVLILLTLTVILGLLAVTGHVADSRDPDYSLGHVLNRESGQGGS